MNALDKARKEFEDHADSCKKCRLVVDRWVTCNIGNVFFKEWRKEYDKSKSTIKS